MNLSDVSSNSSFQVDVDRRFEAPEKQNKTTQLRASDFLQRVVKFLAGSTELRIREMLQKDGSTLWEVHDPQTQTTVVCNSEKEVRVWIEQRYSG